MPRNYVLLCSEAVCRDAKTLSGALVTQAWTTRSTGIAPAGSILRLCCAISDTHTGSSHAMSGTNIGSFYAESGTDIGSSYAMSGTTLGQCRGLYAMSGTDIAYGDTRRQWLWAVHREGDTQVSAYARTMRCPVLTCRYLLRDARC
eukprot:3472898-Rhodomonas_salina.2